MDFGVIDYSGLTEYKNVPRIIASVISSGRATLIELQTVYGIEDAYDLLEVSSVDAHNRRAISKRPQD